MVVAGGGSAQGAVAAQAAAAQAAALKATEADGTDNFEAAAELAFKSYEPRMVRLLSPLSNQCLITTHHQSCARRCLSIASGCFS
eukprot:7439-Heterococcus_DN1.PRE.3